MSSLTPLQAEIAFTVSQKYRVKWICMYMACMHIQLQYNFPLYPWRCDPLYKMIICLPHRTVSFHCVELSGLFNYLGHVANPDKIEGFGSVSNPSKKHDSLFLRRHDRNTVEICDNVRSISCRKLHMGNYLFHYIPQYSGESSVTRIDIECSS